MKLAVAISLTLPLALAGIPAHAHSISPAASADGVPVDAARDHDSILAMQGEYLVDFAFDETVLLQPGYERHPAMRSGASETVIVVEDSPQRIVLQHILVDEKSGHVTKHWRQDWSYQAGQRFEFSDDQTWQVRNIPASVNQGAWTQCVYEVSDAPRYCGTGRWAYENGIATWTSDLSWRPLPRREYSKRDDYNALAVINRHTLTPQGWTHEQFNTKVRRNADGSQLELAREFGFNEYRKTTDTDFKPAYDYWKATQGYWARVRAQWDRYLLDGPGVHLKTKVDGMAMIMPLFGFASDLEEGRQVDDSAITAVFEKWVEPAPLTATATAGR
ncbi:DUF6607 family protein [Pseudoxanthomonas dokdonensis]|uniref:Secreted protein n=1 Tax=Pseudoxanthomonas dokdonensis TaxID=344882 RepID=A0A0R0CJK7_9GAMM|nr:DUF6607 family protein [Pseudoxanthomonas dokdonensis]KRG70121.1 hypothetical protein ABB29_07825 [Pseudoxanthomonas dokdonensis]